MKVGKYFLSSNGGQFSTTSVVKVEGKLLLDNGIQQKKRLDWQKFTILPSVHSWLCKKTRHLSRVQYGCKAAVSFLTNINVKFGLIVLLNSNSNGMH